MCCDAVNSISNEKCGLFQAKMVLNLLIVINTDIHPYFY